MSDASTKHLIELYLEESESPLFLSGFFQSPPRNFHTSEKVEIDVIRDDEDVAVAIQDISAGARQNEASAYTNKGFTPPVYDEEGVISAYSAIRRQAGQDPFQDPVYSANAAVEAFAVFRRLERKIRRAIELQASQVLQTGKLTLTDQNGASVYALDFVPKTTHFPTVTATWAQNGSTGTPLADIDALARVVRRDGKRNPKQLVFGAAAWSAFMANTVVQEHIKNTGLMLGALAPVARGGGATFMGWIQIGSYRYELWLYDGFYRSAAGVLTQYVDDNNMIMLSEGGRLDLTFGSIPMIVAPDQRALSFLPPRISSGQLGIDMTTNAYITPDNKHLKVGCGTRPLTIPTAIDTFGCLKTTTG